jgi:hypothetical protein
MSEAARISGVFLDPKKAFADIAARPRWYWPIILMVIAALGFTYLYTSHVGWERFIRQTMENNSRAQNQTQEQREQAIQTGVKVAPIFGYAGSLVFIPLAALAIAGAVLLMCKMTGAASLDYKHMLAISSYAMLPTLISSILAIIVMFLKDPDQFNLQNPLVFNLGAFLEPPPNTGKALYSLATSIDLFSFWTILLLATGISVAVRKFPFSKALTAVVAPWLIYVLVKAGWTGFAG